MIACLCLTLKHALCRSKGVSKADRASEHPCCKLIPKWHISTGGAATLHRGVRHIVIAIHFAYMECILHITPVADLHHPLAMSWRSQRWRETSEEKRSKERMEHAIINEVRQAAEVHRQVLAHAPFI